MEIHKMLTEFSDSIAYNNTPVAIVLAAGHGKRIKSDTSKMLHKIWGKPTSLRVANAAGEGLSSNNQIIVVGIKADQVTAEIGKAPGRAFVLQENQNGTGDAARVALDILDAEKVNSDIYILPGDMGIMKPEVMADFRKAFENSSSGLMILTGVYNGDPDKNQYGRIIRVPEFDIKGNSTGNDFGNVIEIKEFKDIIAVGKSGKYQVSYNDKSFEFTGQQLLEIQEYNSGVYAGKFEPVNHYIRNIGTDNAQGEVYITDLIKIFNTNGIPVSAYPTPDNDSVMGFNTKSVLFEMNKIYQQQVYKKIGDLVSIEDPDDFFIGDNVVRQVIELADKHTVVNIKIGKGAYIGDSVKINRNIKVCRNSFLDGNIDLQEGVSIEKNVCIKSTGNSKIFIGPNSKISKDSVLQGSVEIGKNCLLFGPVHISGFKDQPTIIGDNVTIEGYSKILNSNIGSGLCVINSILESKTIEPVAKKVAYYMPESVNQEYVKSK